MADAFDLDAYCARVRFSGPAEPTLGTLTALLSAHLSAIPFEGVDRFLGRPIALDAASLQAKLIRSRRGGNCFEHALLLGGALERLGFAVELLGARVRWNAPPDAPMGPREHALLKVRLDDGDHLVDAGFGARIVDRPLRIEVGEDQLTPLGLYRLDRDGGLLRLSASTSSGWRAMYVFGLEPQFPADYEVANAWAPLNPTLPFLTNLVAERVDGAMRWRLVNRRLICEGPGGAILSERTLQTARELGAALEDQFAITPPAPAEALFSRLAR